MPIRIATWNVNGLRARLDALLRFCREASPDVVCLQELKMAQELFPEEALRELYPHLAWWGQPTYNGVALLSKLPLEQVRTGFAEDAPGEGGPADTEARLITAVVAGIRLYGLYCPNGTELGSARFRDKLRWYRRLRAEIERYDRGEDLIVLGDMNVAPDDLDVWDPFKLDGVLLCTVEEREVYAELLGWGLRDAYRERNPFANAFTWWNYQRMGFSRNQGMRIDHVLLSRSLMGRLREVTIHRDVRGWDQPSDHAPVSVDLNDA